MAQQGAQPPTGRKTRADQSRARLISRKCSLAGKEGRHFLRRRCRFQQYGTCFRFERAAGVRGGRLHRRYPSRTADPPRIPTAHVRGMACLVSGRARMGLLPTLRGTLSGIPATDELSHDYAASPSTGRRALRALWCRTRGPRSGRKAPSLTNPGSVKWQSLRQNMFASTTTLMRGPSM